MAKTRALLPYVTEFIDRHGKARHRFRRAGFKGGYFHHPLGSEAYLAEYHAFMAGKIPAKSAPRRIVPRSIDDLLRLYYQSNDFQGQAQPHTLAKRRAVLERFREAVDKKGIRRGTKLVAEASFSALDRIIAKAAIKAEDGTGGPFAGQTLKKQLNGLFKYAVKIGWIDRNPVAFVSFTAPHSQGHHTWSEQDIAQYQARHPLGTNARLALDLMLWTGKRRGDARLLGRHNESDGALRGRDEKTKKTWWLPIAPQLAESIAAMPQSDHLCYLVSANGRPYSSASLGNAMRRWCDQAGLPDCTAHGLRKAISRRMAELNINNAGGKAVTLHAKDSEYALYTAAANQRNLATDAIMKVSTWAASNQDQPQMSNQSKKP